MGRGGRERGEVKGRKRKEKGKGRREGRERGGERREGRERGEEEKEEG